MLKTLIDRLLHSGYEREKESATMDIVARFSRGNTAVQSGHLLDEEGIATLRRKSARAMKRLAKTSKSPTRAA